MTAPRLDESSCARLPAGALPRLAPLRARPDVRGLGRGEDLYVFFPTGDVDALALLLAVQGADLFALREGSWYQVGSLLPARGLPAPEEAAGLPRLLSPAPVHPESFAGAVEPAPLTLARDDRPRPTSALLCPLAALADWAEVATTHQLSALTAALGPGGVALVRGARLPALPGADRFWGERLLAPLGWRPEPALAEAVLLAALGAGPGELVVLRPGSAERVPAGALGPVSRAGVRLAVRGGRP
jgi:hypothetical protein